MINDIRARRPFGSLARHLILASFDDADRLARVAAGTGCAGCLAEYWRGRRDGTEQSAPDPSIHPDLTNATSGADSHQSEAAVPAWYTLQAATSHFSSAKDQGRNVAEAQRISLRRATTATDPSMRGALWRLLKQVRPFENSARRHFVGVIASEGDPLRELSEEAQTIEKNRKIINDAEGRWTEDQWSRIELLREHSLYIGEPWITDHAGRAERGVAADSLALFEDRLLAGRGKWRERLKLLLCTSFLGGLGVGVGVLFFLFTILAALTGYDGSIFNLKSVVSHLFSPISVLDVGSLAAGFLFLFGLAIAWANRCLPNALRMEVPQRHAQDLMVRIATKIWGSEDQREPAAGWRRWVRRRILGGSPPPSVIVVGIQTPEAWSEADRQHLEAFMDLLGSDQYFLLAIHVRTRSEFVNGALAPWVTDPPSSAGPRTIDLGRFDDWSVLYLGDDLDIDGHPPSSGITLKDLLGWGDNVPHGIIASLAGASWSIYNLPPTLITGSLATAPMIVNKPSGSAIHHYRSALEDQLRPLRDLFEARHDGNSKLEDSDIDIEKILDQSMQAEGIRYLAGASAAIKGQGGDRLIGRGLWRRTLRDRLHTAFREDPHQDSETFERYLGKILACAELYHVSSAWQHLESGFADTVQGDLTAATRHTRAAGQLLAERQRRTLSNKQTVMLAQAWCALAESACLVEVPDDPDSQFAGAQLAAALLRGQDVLTENMHASSIETFLACNNFSNNESFSSIPKTPRDCLGHEVAGTLKILRQTERVVSDTLFEGIEGLLTFPDLSTLESGLPKPKTPRGCLEREVKGTLRKLGQMDRVVADTLFERKMNGAWYYFPERLRRAIQDARAEQRKKSWRLVELIARCRTIDQMLNVAHNHAEFLGRFLACVVALAVREVHRNATSEDAALKKQEDLATGIRRLRDRCPNIDISDADQKTAIAAVRHVTAPALAFCTAKHVPDVLNGIAHENAIPPRVDLPGTDIGAYHGVGDRLEKIVYVDYM
ncbi:hypothetical protein LRF89_12800 [Halorhodospira sp. 9621]|uniref:hypothetical protein n=1 Tax=Halorhodospira sp. 9621 TaxID=2899135 RepID=UPI001EE89DD6|nr:hypothetical protein [Halorhodospira sp. 9621]MCG5534312.1 hypothetical protein [Halorhodospira sp. 9621]